MSKLIVRAASRTRETEQSGNHPFNPNSEMHGHALSRVAGLEHVGLWALRIPPGKESFVYHRHLVEEEFLFVLSGRGVVEIEGEDHEIGPGDFVGFPAGTAHGLRNPFDEDLCYLSGGDSRDHEVADYPRHNRRMVRIGKKVAIFPADAAAPFPGVDPL